MKKTLAVLLAVCVVFGAGSAFAQPRNSQDFENRRYSNLPMDFHGQPGQFCEPYSNGNNFGGYGPRHGYGRYGFGCHGFNGGMNFYPDMPKEIREKAVELAKLRVDLEEAMSSRPVNKAKALETYAKMQKLEQEINTWRFAQRLERIEDFNKQRELNKKVPPAPMQHEPKEEAKDAPAK